MKVPASELGKTLNQLGVAAAKVGSELSRTLDQEFTKALIGRVR